MLGTEDTAVQVLLWAHLLMKETCFKDNFLKNKLASSLEFSVYLTNEFSFSHIIKLRLFLKSKVSNCNCLEFVCVHIFKIEEPLNSVLRSLLNMLSDNFYDARKPLQVRPTITWAILTCITTEIF